MSNIPQPQRHASRSSGSIRAPSPASSLDDGAAVHRKQTTPMSSPPPPSYRSPTPTNTKASRRTSYEVLQGIAGPDSNLPLPVPNSPSSSRVDENGIGGIKAGVPMTSSPPYNNKRISSPTRTLSRIPVASVGNARALADEGSLSPASLGVDTSLASLTSPTSPSLQPPSPSPSGSGSSNRRISLTPGGTTKVLADLQTGVINARNALENTKAQLRLSQRSVATLTRQTEDLKEGRERLRLENEGLNNVVARKERLLQEVLERARKAESESTTLRTQLKSSVSESKQSIRQLESTLAESTALSQKSEREYLTLRSSLSHLKEEWKRDVDSLRKEMERKEERWKEEREAMRRLVNEVRLSSTAGKEIVEVRRAWAEDKEKAKQVEHMWGEQVERMRERIEKNDKEGEDAVETARVLEGELKRLRRMIQNRNSGREEEPPNDP